MRFEFAFYSSIFAIVMMLYELAVGLFFVHYEGQAPWTYTSYDGIRAISPFSWQATIAWYVIGLIIYLVATKILKLE